MTKKPTPSVHNSAQMSNTPIAWDSIHARLDRLRTLIESGWRVEPERVNAILSARAQRLAQPLIDGEAATKTLEILEFSLALQHYAVVSDYVREVFPLSDFTPVPCTPPFVLGIANVRGQIISIVDLRKFFGLPSGGITDLNKVIVVEDSAMSFGIVVDFIVEVRQIKESELLPPTNINGVSGQYLLGVTAQRLSVIDTQKLLSDKTIIVDDVVAT